MSPGVRAAGERGPATEAGDQENADFETASEGAHAEARYKNRTIHMHTPNQAGRRPRVSFLRDPWQSDPERIA